MPWWPGYRKNFIWIYLVGIAGIIGWILLAFGMTCTDTMARIERIKEKELLMAYKEKLKEMTEQISFLKQQLWNATISRSQPAKKPFSSTQGSTLFLITPTHTRPEQKAELTRLSQTLLLVPNLHWIVVEDSTAKTLLVSKFLSESSLNYTHLNVKTPDNYKLKSKDPNWLKPRGVLQRNLALHWLRNNIDIQTQKGVVYFADDDNTYSLKLFEEMRDTKIVSVWPVGLVGGLRYEKPIVNNGKVTQWFTYWKPRRPFAMDMAGFAVNLHRFFEFKEAKFDYNVPRGYQESVLLQGLQVKMTDLEPKAELCTKILVWHTRTEKTKLKNEERMKMQFGHGSDAQIEL